MSAVADKTTEYRILADSIDGDHLLTLRICEDVGVFLDFDADNRAVGLNGNFTEAERVVAALALTIKKIEEHMEAQ